MFTRFPTTRYLFCFFVLLGSSISLRAQDCYELLFPGTGLPTAVDDSLAAAACRLRADLPPAEQASFRTLSVSEYQISNFYEATDRTALRERIRTDVAADHPYYVLFYWRSDVDRLFASLELDLRLPTTGFLSCMSDLQRQALYAEYIAFAAQLAAEHVENWGPAQVEKTVLDSLTARMGRIAACCVPGVKNICTLCVDSESISNLIQPIDYAIRYAETGTAAINGNHVNNEVGTNYYIREIDTVWVAFGGSTTRLVDMLQTYFATYGKDVNWRILISGEEICDPSDSEAAREFFDAPPVKNAFAKSGAVATHEGYAYLDAEGRLNVKLRTGGEYYHPLDLKITSVNKLLLEGYPTVKIDAAPGIPHLNTAAPNATFAGYTPAGTLLQLSYATLAAFYPTNGIWPAGTIGAFQVDGRRYWGAWEPSLHKFLGYVPVAEFNEDFPADALFLLPKARQNSPRAVLAVTVAEACKIRAHSREWRVDDRLLLHQNFTRSTPDLAPTILGAIDLPDYEYIGLMPTESCLGEVEYCRQVLLENHPYLIGHNPIKTALQANPCLVKEFEHENFNVIYPRSEWMEGLKNITAVALAIPFSAVTIELTAAPLLESGSGAQILIQGRNFTQAAIALLETQASILSGTTLSATTAGQVGSAYARQASKQFAEALAIDLMLQSMLLSYIHWDDPNFCVPCAVDLTASIVAGGDNALFPFATNIKAEITATLGSGVLNCIYDGFYEGGRIKSEFAWSGCARGALVAVLARGLPAFSPGIKSIVRNITPQEWTYFWLKFLSDKDIHKFGPNVLPDKEVIESATYANSLGGSSAIEQQLARNFAEMRSAETAFITNVRTILESNADNAEWLELIFRQPDAVFDRFKANPKSLTDFFADLTPELKAAFKSKPALVGAWEVARQFTDPTDVPVLTRLANDMGDRPNLASIITSHVDPDGAFNTWNRVSLGERFISETKFYHVMDELVPLESTIILLGSILIQESRLFGEHRHLD